jgi:C4-dicarboxylate transporter DctM subunit
LNTIRLPSFILSPTPFRHPRAGRKEQGIRFIKALPAIMMPVIVLGGIYGGVFTPTEAGAVACIYTLIIGAFVYRRLAWKNIWSASIESARLTGIILILLCSVMLMSRALSIIGLPEAMGDWILKGGITAPVFLVTLSILLLILGMIVDAVGLVAIFPLSCPRYRRSISIPFNSVLFSSSPV